RFMLGQMIRPGQRFSPVLTSRSPSRARIGLLVSICSLLHPDMGDSLSGWKTQPSDYRFPEVRVKALAEPSPALPTVRTSPMNAFSVKEPEIREMDWKEHSGQLVMAKES